MIQKSMQCTLRKRKGRIEIEACVSSGNNIARFALVGDILGMVVSGTIISSRRGPHFSSVGQK
jgi:hypothetical protein